jgi:hypothetical protein
MVISDRDQDNKRLDLLFLSLGQRKGLRKDFFEEFELGRVLLSLSHDVRQFYVDPVFATDKKNT